MSLLLGLPHKVWLISLLFPPNSALAEEVLAEFEVPAIFGDGVETQDSKLKLGMSRVSMHLTRIWSERLHEQVEILGV